MLFFFFHGGNFFRVSYDFFQKKYSKKNQIFHCVEVGCLYGRRLMDDCLPSCLDASFGLLLHAQWPIYSTYGYDGFISDMNKVWKKKLNFFFLTNCHDKCSNYEVPWNWKKIIVFSSSNWNLLINLGSFLKSSFLPQKKIIT